MGQMLIGVLFGVLFYFFIIRPYMPSLAGRFIRRHERRHRPDRGTRPQVRVTCNGITYDVTDTMLRLTDREDGFARWIVVGPEHVRLTEQPGQVRVIEPAPLDSVVIVEMVDDPPRFCTHREILAQYTIYGEKPA